MAGTSPGRRRYRAVAKRRRGPLGRIAEALLAVAVLALLLLMAGSLQRFNAVSQSGDARIADGDTLDLAGQRIRLQGMDAPELNQQCALAGRNYPCGRRAKDALEQLVAGRKVSCRGWERDRYGRLLAICTAGTVELNRRLVADGWAVAYGDYDAEERAARRDRRGIWAGAFERPDEWRASHGQPAEQADDTLGKIGDWLRGLLAWLVRKENVE